MEGDWRMGPEAKDQGKGARTRRTAWKLDRFSAEDFGGWPG